MIPIDKLEGRIKVYIEFKDLIAKHPKDDFSLPNIKTLVNNIIGYKMYLLMDGFLGYNQIWFDPKDQHKIAFTIPSGMFYYKVIPLGLNNISTIYQRTMMYVFYDMIHNIVEHYEDDLIFKSRTKDQH